jgi:hypothetical protein
LEQREQLKPLSALGGSAGRPCSSLALLWAALTKGSDSWGFSLMQLPQTPRALETD